jgi:hypothetical protein
MAKAITDPMTLLLSHIVTELDENICWTTDYVPTATGYVRVSMPAGYPRIKAHRFMWEFYNAEPLGDRVVLHTCDNPGCVNPAHLVAGTQQDNLADMCSKNRNAVPRIFLEDEHNSWVDSDLPMQSIADAVGTSYANVRKRITFRL